MMVIATGHKSGTAYIIIRGKGKFNLGNGEDEEEMIHYKDIVDF